MPVDQYWLIDDYVYMMDFQSITFEDAKLMNVQMLQLLNASKNPVYLFLDTRNLKTFPTNVIELKSHLDYLKHPKVKL
jgi:hypothetical protein